MEFIDQLEDLHTVEVSFHGPQEAYFQPMAAACCTCCGSGPAERQEFRPDDEG